ncbi:kinase-like domain-containing protein [Elsinoe ampelina]|uniref:Kinase-like domain-containing protein n=1 Tax=Elsinoe ampelina TaxID=302913 RepID=A0A6A6GA44_9PEZI|nr:kinase-like domain-containing protein [Elsinoe ampelina]
MTPPPDAGTPSPVPSQLNRPESDEKARGTRAQHEGSKSLAVNDTLVKRTLTRIALATIGRINQGYGVCVTVSPHLIIKRSSRVHLTEAATMAFVAAKTSIPVPKVYCAFVRNGKTYIVMEKMRGHPIPQVWNKLSSSSREKIFTQLKGMLDELRALPPPNPNAVQSCVGGSLTDCRITHCQPRMGPWTSIQEFHRWLRQNFDPTAIEQHSHTEEEWNDLLDMNAKHDGPWPPVVFTHADLNPFNIMVDGDKITGIIDWEFSGWYPHYWEYTTACYGNLGRLWWQDVVDKVLEVKPEEMKMEVTRQRWWGEF